MEELVPGLSPESLHKISIGRGNSEQGAGNIMENIKKNSASQDTDMQNNENLENRRIWLAKVGDIFRSLVEGFECQAK